MALHKMYFIVTIWGMPNFNHWQFKNLTYERKKYEIIHYLLLFTNSQSVLALFIKHEKCRPGKNTSVYIKVVLYYP